MTDEPLFMGIRDSDPAFQQTIRDAQATHSLSSVNWYRPSSQAPTP
jgi:hypothetical protein